MMFKTLKSQSFTNHKHISFITKSFLQTAQNSNFFYRIFKLNNTSFPKHIDTHLNNKIHFCLDCVRHLERICLKVTEVCLYSNYS